MDPIARRLLDNAYLFDDPGSYEAGVLDTLMLLRDLEAVLPELHDELDRVSG